MRGARSPRFVWAGWAHLGKEARGAQGPRTVAPLPSTASKRKKARNRPPKSGNNIMCSHDVFDQQLENNRSRRTTGAYIVSVPEYLPLSAQGLTVPRGGLGSLGPGMNQAQARIGRYRYELGVEAFSSFAARQQEQEKSPEWKKVRNTPAVGGRAPPSPSQRALIRRIWPSRATFGDWAPAVSGGGASHSGQGR